MDINDVRCDRCGAQLHVRETTGEDGYRLILVQPCPSCCLSEDLPVEIGEELVQSALKVLAEEVSAKKWLSRTVRALSGADPAELAKTEAGRQAGGI